MNFNEVNQRNIDIFALNGIDNEMEKRHTCVLCNKKVCINDSASNQGKNLICYTCLWYNFPDAADAFKWIRQEEVE